MNDARTTQEQLKAQWEAMADDWIGLQAEGDVHREDLLDPWMLEAIGEVSGLKVIDLGCGEGRFTRKMTQLGARVTGVDLCTPFIEYAEARLVDDETYLLANMEALNGVRDGEFHLAVSYLSLVDVLNMGRAVAEAFRVLVLGGRFVVCNVHPMRMASAGGWIKQGDRKLHYPVDNYFDEGVRELSWIRQTGKQWTNFHRSLETHVETFLGAGFAIEAIREPRPTREQAEERPEVADELRVPNFIIFVLSKPPGATRT